jgi:hypothetical protein
MPTIDTTIQIDIAQCNACMEVLMRRMTEAKQKPWPGRVKDELNTRLVNRAVKEAGNSRVLLAEIIAMVQLAAYGLAIDYAVHVADNKLDLPPFDGQHAAMIAHANLFRGAAWRHAPGVATLLRSAYELAERIG